MDKGLWSFKTWEDLFKDPTPPTRPPRRGDYSWHISQKMPPGSQVVVYEFPRCQTLLTNPEHPDADLIVMRVDMDKYDPRHPNPSAGSIRTWSIVTPQKRVLKSHKNSILVYAEAHKVHLGLLAKSKASAEAARIAKEQEQELQRMMDFNEALEGNKSWGSF